MSFRAFALGEKYELDGLQKRAEAVSTWRSSLGKTPVDLMRSTGSRREGMTLLGRYAVSRAHKFIDYITIAFQKRAVDEGLVILCAVREED